jgi:hypothetical protein
MNGVPMLHGSYARLRRAGRKLGAIRMWTIRGRVGIIFRSTSGGFTVEATLSRGKPETRSELICLNFPAHHSSGTRFWVMRYGRLGAALAIGRLTTIPDDSGISM